MGKPADLTEKPLTEADVRRIIRRVVREELTPILERLRVLETRAVDRELEAEAATHGPGCKCGRFGHY